MNTTAIYHRPESEFAYLFEKTKCTFGCAQLVKMFVTCNYYAGIRIRYTKAWYQRRIEMDKILSTDLHDYWQVTVSAEFRRLSYGFSIESLTVSMFSMVIMGSIRLKEQYLEMNNNYFRMPYFQEADRFKVPEWVKETVWYQIFPERFANGDPSMILKAHCLGGPKSRSARFFWWRFTRRDRSSGLSRFARDQWDLFLSDF